MSRIERSTPLENFDELLSVYETTNRQDIPIYQKVEEMYLAMSEIFNKEIYEKLGVVLSVDGTWGIGKTTFINLVIDKLSHENVAVIKYDSLFYGNVSEATSIFISDIFRNVRNTFGINLKDTSIAENISPKFEIGAGLPKLSFDLNLNNRNSTEFIKDSLSKKLRKIDGKIIVIIDDLDRVSADDVVHFLRIVRVLRELPNFIIILPIDRSALEELLNSVKITNPAKYLEKIVDWSINLDPDLLTAKTLFINKIKRNTSVQLHGLAIDELWRFVLLELMLNTLDADDIRSTGVVLGTGISDQTSQNYERKARSSRSGNNSFMRGFITRTSKTHGGPYNLVTSVVNETNPAVKYYRSYTSLYGAQNFVDFIRGFVSPSLGYPEQLADRTINFISSRWYRDIDYLTSAVGQGTFSDNYDVSNLANLGIDQNTFDAQLESNVTSLWNEMRSWLEAYYPDRGLKLLNPRSINKIATHLDYETLETIMIHPVENDRSLQLLLYDEVKNAISRVNEQS